MKQYTEIAYFLVVKKLSGKEKKKKKPSNHCFNLVIKKLYWHFSRCQAHFSILQNAGSEETGLEISKFPLELLFTVK